MSKTEYIVQPSDVCFPGGAAVGYIWDGTKHSPERKGEFVPIHYWAVPILAEEHAGWLNAGWTREEALAMLHTV